MLIPWPTIVALAILILVLAIVAIVSTFAWFGIAQQHEELLARVKVAQIDIYDLKRPMRRVEGRR